METLAIRPFTRPLCGSTVVPPGSKSITNRALILAALSDKTVTLTGALFSRDSRIMVECLRQLGFAVSCDEALCSITVTGQGGRIPASTAKLHMGNAGTAARFVTALLTLGVGGVYEVDGDPAMKERPMRGLLNALERSGSAKITYLEKAGHIPFRLEAKGFQGGVISLDASASSQLLSALLMVAPFGKADTRIELQGETVSHPFIVMTLNMMLARFGLSAQFGSDALIRFVEGGRYGIASTANPYASAPSVYAVEPDATAASYFIALPFVVGGKLSVPLPEPSLQGDAAFARAFSEICSGVNDVDFNAISDTFLTAAAVAPLLNAPLTIRGIAHTRKQETDRIAAMATELAKLGQGVEDTHDSLKVSPQAIPLPRAGACYEIETYEDHRVSMSFAVLGCRDLRQDGTAWLTLKDPMCCRKTYPNFFQELSRLYHETHA